jgi:hypothetical protein
MQTYDYIVVGAGSAGAAVASEAQKQAYVLADNQLAITGSGWDPELLRLELGELKLGGFDLSLTGFGDLELKDIMADRTAGLTDPDDAPAVPEQSGVADGRSVAARAAPSPLRRQHGGDGRRARARRRRAAPDGHRSALWSRVRPKMAE